MNDAEKTEFGKQAPTTTEQQQQLFYSLLIQVNPNEPVPKTIWHINPTILLSTSNQSSPFSMNQRIFST